MSAYSERIELAVDKFLEEEAAVDEKKVEKGKKVVGAKGEEDGDGTSKMTKKGCSS